jgi:HEAT repeat protein
MSKHPTDQLEKTISIKNIIEMFRKWDRKDCNFALETLSKIGKPAVAPLIAALEDQQIAYWVVRALGEIKDTRAIEPLINTMRAEDGELGFAAAEALGKIGNDAVPFLIAVLNDSNWNLRCSVINALGMIKNAQAVMPLITIFEGKDYMLSDAAASALGEIGSEQAVEPLIQLLENEALNVRISALFALSKIGNKTALEPVLNLLKNEDNIIRFHAIFTVGVLGDIDTLPVLEWIAQNDQGETFGGKIADNARKAIKKIKEREIA